MKLDQIQSTISRSYRNKIVVIKYGGNAIVDETLQNSFASEVVFLKKLGVLPVVVHGGGPQISAMLEKLKKKTEFVNGERVTDAETLSIVEMVLSGNVNKHLVKLIKNAGGCAVGISGKDGNMLVAEKNLQKSELGFVGQVVKVDSKIVRLLIENDFIPVIAPVSTSEEGNDYNVNADFAAAAIAQALRAEKLMLLTNALGVLDKDNNLIRQLKPDTIRQFIEDSTIVGGMIPKINCALDTLDKGISGVHIVDGRVPHVITNTLMASTNGLNALDAPGTSITY